MIRVLFMFRLSRILHVAPGLARSTLHLIGYAAIGELVVPDSLTRSLLDLSNYLFSFTFYLIRIHGYTSTVYFAVASSYGLLGYVAELDYVRRSERSSSADQLDHKHNQRYDQKDVNVPGDNVESNESQQPGQE
jgi:hypothetical protein